MVNKNINVAVAFAQPNEQVVISMTLSSGQSVAQVIKDSGILERFPQLDLATLKVGIFGSLCPLDKKVESDDRIEIYRPLLHSPMQARRNRAERLDKGR